MKNFEKPTEPMLLKIPGNANKYYNVAPFFGENHFLGMQENHFEFLRNVVKRCQWVVGTAQLDSCPLDEADAKELLYYLFELERMFEKCGIVNV